jgi:hypothetical protein
VPNNFYHFISGDNGRNVGDAAREIDTLYNSGVLAFNGHNSGIFVVNGDMTVLNDVTSKWDGVTLIVTGKFLSLDNNHTYATAGPAARNISVLAGADLGTLDTSKRCASDRSNWVFKVDGNRNVFEGIIYVPHGQALFVGNTTGGSAKSAAVVAYSLYLGSGDSTCSGNNNSSCQAQNWQFLFNSNMLSDPYPAITLQH